MEIKNQEGIDINYEINFKEIIINFNELKSNIILNIKNSKSIMIETNNQLLKIKINSNWFILLSDVSLIKIRKLYNLDLYTSDIEHINLYKYGNPNYEIPNKYNCFYSFDGNYIQGAFASINSLLCNFRKEELPNLFINIIFPLSDIDIFQKKYLELIQNDNFNFQPNLRIFLINKSIIPDYILETKCFKGGNHLLKLCNFSRLIIGKLIRSNKVLYLDSDTIVQSDISQILDNIKNEKFVIMGKKSNLNYTNILNNENIEYAKRFLGNRFNFSNNIIYTGTLIINPNRFLEFEKRIESLVQLHNSILDKGGLYKLFTMSLINLSFYDSIGFFDDYLINIVDLGFRNNLYDKCLNANILDWSGIYKPWFLNGLYKDLWQKYNLIKINSKIVTLTKDTIEEGSF